MSRDALECVQSAMRYFEAKNGRKPSTLEEFRFIGQVAREMQKIAAEPELNDLPDGDETVWN